MYLNQSLIGEVAGAQQADRLREASVARRARKLRRDHASGPLQQVIAGIRGWAGFAPPAPQPSFMEEVETIIARCTRETPPAAESPADLDEVLVPQLLIGYTHPATEPPPGTSYQAEWIPDHPSNPYLRDAA
jgi:hypothetical protein